MRSFDRPALAIYREEPSSGSDARLNCARRKLGTSSESTRISRGGAFHSSLGRDAWPNRPGFVELWRATGHARESVSVQLETVNFFLRVKKGSFRHSVPREPESAVVVLRTEAVRRRVQIRLISNEKIHSCRSAARVVSLPGIRLMPICSQTRDSL